jgi:hypothetical protein
VKRFVAVALFVLATSLWAGTMLGRLATARAAAAAVPDVPGDAVAALRDVARVHRLTLTRAAVAGRVAGHRRTAFAMTGPEPALRAAIADLEGGRPAIRFLSWRLRPAPGTADRLICEGLALVAAR